MSTITTSPATSTISSSSTSVAASTALTAININAAQFREIHKNTWLKRLTAEGKKITVGPKKTERSWVVFCVHDDTEALLEGYAEPRQAATHNPVWVVSMRDTLHISHALIPNSHEFEFVITLSNEVMRFHAMSWEIMQEWVDTLRSKLREMKIISPKENLYTKLPEIRAPLLPTRDPTSPLPAPPPVPAAIVPGVERVIPHPAQDEDITTTLELTNISAISEATAIQPLTSQTSATSNQNSNSSITSTNHTLVPNLTSMSNTLTQNLLNMLSNPISAYSEILHEEIDITEYDVNISNVESQHHVEFPSLLLHSSNASSSSGQNRSEIASNADNGTNSKLYSNSTDALRNSDNITQCEIPRPHTSRSLSAGAADKSNKKQEAKLVSHNAPVNNVPATCSTNNITELEIDLESTIRTTLHFSTFPIEIVATTASSESALNDSKRNVTIIQVSTNEGIVHKAIDVPPKLPTKNTAAEIFKFPEMLAATDAAKAKQHDYKSNVQIVPSNSNFNTIQVLSQHQNGTSLQKVDSSALADITSTQISMMMDSVESGNSTDAINIEGQKVTTVHVSGDSAYGTCYSNNITTATLSSTEATPKLSRKIILTANTSGVTNITVNNPVVNQRESTKKFLVEPTVDTEVMHNVGNVHYDKVFLSSSTPTATVSGSTTITSELSPLSPNLSAVKQWNCPQWAGGTSICSVQPTSQIHAEVKPTPPSSPENKIKMKKQEVAANCVNSRNKFQQTNAIDVVTVSPIMIRRRITSPTNTRTTNGSNQPQRPIPLTRGLTEALITARPSRRDFNFSKLPSGKVKTTNISCNNALTPSITSGSPSTNNNGNRIISNSSEVHRRSSSTSDARNLAQSSNNNEFSANRTAGNNSSAGLEIGGNTICIQQPPQRFRNILESNVSNNDSILTSSPVTKRMTLREQQVMQLRREIMHPGGVRLQLRRKDCLGSIAWVDAFGAVWVAGWKQKEHPVLYNALHIGDQLLTIAGVTINSAADANKIIRNTNTLFVEVLVRRIPYGRGYAIRREREGQCLGLIRDGNSSTIVDVVPNSLAARHGLPPKTQSCDGATLTFWVLTEINGRPLNLFFKDNEIRDRLNSVGRDISILVQPSDLITKLKKQLKSLRGYKDYLVQ